MLSTYLTRLPFGQQTKAPLFATSSLPSTVVGIFLEPALQALVKLQLSKNSSVLGLLSKGIQSLAPLARVNVRLIDIAAAQLKLIKLLYNRHFWKQEKKNNFSSNCMATMLPFPNQGNQRMQYYQYPPYQAMNMMNPALLQQQQQQLMYLQQNQQAANYNRGFMNNQDQFKGRGFSGPMRGGGGGNRFSPQQGQFYPQQQYPQNNNRDRNNLKRKSSEDNFASRKVGRFQERGSTPLNSSRSSFTPSTSTSMHIPLVNGAKPLHHIPGQPCERITEAIVQYYNDFHQSEEDLKHKIILSKCLYAIVKGIFPGCRLFIVGSSLSGFGTHTSDMDLCLLVSQVQDIDQKIEAVYILNALHKALKRCSFIKSSQVIKAKVPILKFTDAKKDIECDLNINNWVGIRNTHLLKYYCLADPRVAPLMLFIKFWARFHDINDAHKRSISSYSLALMLIHYLQVCTPPVVPCLQKLYPDRFNINMDVKELRLDEPLQDLVSKNQDSLGTLMQGFLDYYSYTFRPEYDVISVREGCVLNKFMVMRNRSEPQQWKYLCIEEPFDMSNTARSVFDPYIFQRIQKVFNRSAETLRLIGDVAAILSQPF